jgi:hypothetical protein
LKNYSVAESKYLEAHEVFSTLGDQLNCACIRLDLAICLFDREGGSKALEFAAQALAVFETLRVCSKTLEALHFVQVAVSTATLEGAMLRTLRSCLWHDPLKELRQKREPESGTLASP